MLKKVKVLTDEQTRQSLNRLRDDFAEILAPLKKLDSIQSVSELQGSVKSIETKIDEILKDQQDSLKKTNFIYDTMVELKDVLNKINWEE